MKHHRAAIWVVGLLTIAGCGVGDAVLALRPLAESRRKALTSANDQGANASPTRVVADLPYPDRTDPFTVSGQESELPGDDSYAVPQLRGFVDVHEPIAVFRYQGQSHLVGANDTLADWDIVSIQPPVVEVETTDGRHRIVSLRDGKLQASGKDDFE